MRTQRLSRAGFAVVVVGVITLVLPRDAAAQYIPYKVQINGGLCDSGPSPSSNPSITIDSDSTFVVTSILISRIHDHLAGKDALLLARTGEQAREMSRREVRLAK